MILVAAVAVNSDGGGDRDRGGDRDGVVNSVLLPSIALNCLPGCCTKMFNCSGILD
jgi:hypothetical protein